MGLALGRAGLETCALNLERTEGPAFCWGAVKVEAFCECDGAPGWAWHGAEPGLRLEAEGTAVGDVDRPRCSVLWDVHAAAALSRQPLPLLPCRDGINIQCRCRSREFLTARAGGDG